ADVQQSEGLSRLDPIPAARQELHADGGVHRILGSVTPRPEPDGEVPENPRVDGDEVAGAGSGHLEEHGRPGETPRIRHEARVAALEVDHALEMLEGGAAAQRLEEPCPRRGTPE